jgi:hypothetical protein
VIRNPNPILTQMKVYIAYRGDLDKHGKQTFEIIGVFRDESQAHFAVQSTITESGVEVKTITTYGVTYTVWSTQGWEYIDLGKVETHELIG